MIQIWLNRTLGVAVALVLFFMMGLTLVDVVMRYVFHSPIGASFEVTELALGLLVFGGLPLVTLRDEHIAIEFIDLFMPASALEVLRRLIESVMAGCLGVFCWRLWAQANRFAAYGETTASAMIPLAPFHYIMSALAGLTAVLLVIRALTPGRRDWSGGRADDQGPAVG